MDNVRLHARQGIFSLRRAGPSSQFFICDIDFITYIKTRSEQKFIKWLICYNLLNTKVPKSTADIFLFSLLLYRKR